MSFEVMGLFGKIARLFFTAVLLSIVALAVIYEANIYFEPTACSTDVDCPDVFFAETYERARAKFIRAAQKNGITTSSHTIYVDPDTGVKYTMDVAVVKGTGKGLIVHTSGVHGAEGFAGSAIQVAFLERLARLGPKGLDRLPTIVFVHAVNPFGFANNRRFNENNVDLNRNHLNAEEWTEVLKRDPDFSGYESISNLHRFSQAPTRLDFYKLMLTVPFYALTRFYETKRALVTGQYHDPNGPFYGGSKTEKSLIELENALKPFKNRTNVIVIDVHSGLGPSGVDTLIVPSSKDLNNARNIWNDRLLDCPTCGDSGGKTAVGKGYEDVRGMVVYDRFFDMPTVATSYEEFGTGPPILVVSHVLLETAAFHFSRWSYLHQHWGQRMKHFFCVPTLSWKNSILYRGISAIDEAAGYIQRK